MSDSTDSSTTLTERYQIKKRLGSGGSGDAFLAWDTSLRREVVIKRVRSEKVEDEMIPKILDEAAKMAAIKHPNIISIYDVSMTEGSPCIVMEYVQGRTLDERVLEDGPFSPDGFVELAKQCLDALVAAHQSNLIHRDLKPSNIMIVDHPSGLFQVKVLDFGLAKFVDAEAPSPQTVAIDGSIRGSIHYISPEQLNHDAVDARSDLYSLACSLYLALSGHEPFTGDKVSEIITAHLTHRVQALTTVRPGAPKAISAWLMKMLSREPSHRFPSALAALDALQSASMKDGISTATGTIRIDRRSATLPAPGTSPGRSRIFVAAIALAVIAIGALCAWFFLLQGEGKGSDVAAAVVSSIPEDGMEPSRAASPTPEPALPEPTPVVIAPTAAAAVSASQPVQVVVPPPSVEAPAAEPAPSPKAPIPVETVFEVVGSNTIGAKLMPRLMEAFLNRMKMEEVAFRETAAEESEVAGNSPIDGARKAVAIKAHGSSTSFKALLAEECEIGMSSRPAKDEEVAAFTPFGDLRSAACEHVIGLDGLAVIVNRSNPIQALTVAQVAGLFSGEITDWAEVGGTPGPVNLYARDDKSGTYDTFKSLVLDKKPLRDDSARFEDSNELSDRVAADPSGIGFIGLPYVRNSRALALSEEGTQPMLPSPFTVATEDYALARRLFLYTPAVPKHPWTASFVEFVLSEDGQAIVEEVGFIPQRIEEEEITNREDMPEAYRELIAAGARRLSLNFRFRPNETELDSKGVRDLDRIVRFLAKPENRNRKTTLFGFSDSVGQRSTNLKLSKDRADAVAKQFAMRGLPVTEVSGLGPDMPVASNESEAGRNKNRRVEVWIE